MKKIKLAVSPFLITLKYVLSTAYQCTRLEIYQHKAENPKMSRIVLATWASSKFGAHLTLSTISHVLKKHTDLESLTDTEISGQTPLRHSESEDGEIFINVGRLMPDKEFCPNWGNHQGQVQGVSERIGFRKGTIKFSSRCLQPFQKRNKLSSFRIHG